MRVKFFAFLAAACLLGSSNLDAQRVAVPTSTNVARVRSERLTADSTKITIAFPALAENEDFQALSYETQDGLVQKLACYIDSTTHQLDTVAVNKLFHGIGKTAADWNAALNSAPQCNNRFNVSQVSSKLSVLTVRPWYEPATMWKLSNLHGDDPNTRYQSEGFGGDLNKLSAQMKEKVTVHVLDSVTAKGDSLRHPMTLSVPSFFLKYGQLDTAQTMELVKLLENKQCAITRIPRGMPYYKNTGVRVVGMRRIYDHDDAFLVARCALKNGRVIDILQYCTNIAHPLMTAEYSFVATKKRIAIPVRKESTPTPPIIYAGAPPTTVVSGQQFFCFRGIVQAAVCTCVAATAIQALVSHKVNVCGIPFGGKEEEKGNKPVGKPITQFDVIPISGGANLSIGISPSPEAQMKTLNLPSPNTGLARGTSIRSFQANIGIKVGVNKIQNLFGHLR
ncbi:MAG: hypothetical protein NVSMB66_1400 [Candidatus Doudnabacteria bacterium]